MHMVWLKIDVKIKQEFEINVLDKVEGCFLWERQWSGSMAYSPMKIGFTQCKCV